MNRTVKIIIAIFISLIVLLFMMFAYLGGFQSIIVEERQFGPFIIAYRDLQGNDLSKVGEITTLLERNLRGAGLNDLQPFDLFYPNGKGEVGFLIHEADTTKFKAQTPSVKVKIIPSGMYIVTSFQWKNRLSYLVGYMKVDPALSSYRKMKGYKKTWAATLLREETITYLQPIEKVDE